MAVAFAALVWVALSLVVAVLWHLARTPRPGNVNEGGPTGMRDERRDRNLGITRQADNAAAEFLGETS